MLQELAALVAGEEMQRARRQPTPRALIPQAMGGGQHSVGRDQGAGAEAAHGFVHPAYGTPGEDRALHENTVVRPLDPGQAHALGRHGRTPESQGEDGGREQRSVPRTGRNR